MQLKLIETYSLVCDLFDKNPQWNFIRLSNNNQPAQFTDQEAVTIYLFVGYYQKYSKIKEIHNFARHYLHEQYIQLELFTPECIKLRDFAYNNLFFRCCF